MYDDRYWSKVLCSTIPIPLYDLKVKVMDLEFLCLSFTLKLLEPHYFQTLDIFVYVWYMYEDTDWSNILHCAIPTHTWSQGQGPELEFLC